MLHRDLIQIQPGNVPYIGSISGVVEALAVHQDTKAKTMMKNNLIALLDQTYPGVNALLDSPVRKDGTQKWVDFAAPSWHIDCVRNMSQTAFSKRYRKWCKRHGYNFSSDKVIKIYGKAQDQIAMMPKDALTKLLVKQAVDALNAA